MLPPRNRTLHRARESNKGGSFDPIAGGSYRASDDTYVGGLGQRNEGASLGIYYARQRFYDPSIGRFLNQDPIGFAGGLNLYAYVNQNPINEYDPEGLRPVTPAGSSSHDLLRTNGRGGLTNRVPESPTPATSTTLSKPDGLSPSDAFRQGIKTAAIGAALAASVYALEAMVARLVALGTYGSCVNFAQSTGLLRAGQAIIPQIQNGVLNIVIHGRQLTPAVVEALSSYILMMKKVHKIQKARLLTCGGAAAAAEMEAATGVAVWGTEKDVWVWVITFVSPF